MTFDFRGLIGQRIILNRRLYYEWFDGIPSKTCTTYPLAGCKQTLTHLWMGGDHSEGYWMAVWIGPMIRPYATHPALTYTLNSIYHPKVAVWTFIIATIYTYTHMYIYIYIFVCVCVHPRVFVKSWPKYYKLLFSNCLMWQTVMLTNVHSLSII